MEEFITTSPWIRSFTCTSSFGSSWKRTTYCLPAAISASTSSFGRVGELRICMRVEASYWNSQSARFASSSSGYRKRCRLFRPPAESEHTSCIFPDVPTDGTGHGLHQTRPRQTGCPTTWKTPGYILPHPHKTGWNQYLQYTKYQIPPCWRAKR